MIVTKGWKYRSAIREVKKTLGIKAKVEIVKGMPKGVNPSDFNKFIAYALDEKGDLVIFIHEMELKRLAQDQLKPFLAKVLSHENLHYLGMEKHEDVEKKGYGEKDLSAAYDLGLQGIAKEYQGIRDTYLLTERVYGHEDIAVWLEGQMKGEPEKTRTLLVPQFLLSTVQPIVNRMVEEGKKGRREEGKKGRREEDRGNKCKF